MQLLFVKAEFFLLGIQSVFAFKVKFKKTNCFLFEMEVYCLRFKAVNLLYRATGRAIHNYICNYMESLCLFQDAADKPAGVTKPSYHSWASINDLKWLTRIWSRKENGADQTKKLLLSMLLKKWLSRREQRSVWSRKLFDDVHFSHIL